MATNIPDWQGLINRASQILQVDVISYCEQLNIKTDPRYYRANVRRQNNPQITWRMKVVNPCRDDRNDICICNSYNNRDHARLVKSAALQTIIAIPAYLHMPSQCQRTALQSYIKSGHPIR